MDKLVLSFRGILFMKKRPQNKHFLFLIIIFSALMSFARTERHTRNGKPIPPNRLIKSLINSNENDINLAKIALELSNDIDKTINIKEGLAKIKTISAQVKKRAGNSTDPKVRIEALNQVIFHELELRYDFSDPTAKKPENNLLGYTLNTFKGSCLTMPLLYLAVAQELKWPIYPVSLQTHLFLRYVVNNETSINIEATSGGGSFTDDWYKNHFEISPESIKNGHYLKTMTYKEMAAILLQFNSDYYFKKRNHQKAFEYINAAIEIFPKHPNFLMVKGFMFRDLWIEFEKKFRFQEASILWKDAKYYGDMAKSMGMKDIDNTKYLQKMKTYNDQEKNRKPASSLAN